MTACNRRARGRACAAIAAGALACSAHAGNTWTATATHAHPQSGATFQGLLADSAGVNVTVVLRLRNTDTLSKTTAALFDPRSPHYHHWLTRSDILDQFAPTPASAQAVARYLVANGFSGVTVSDSRLLVHGRGSALAVRHAFNARLGHFRKGGIEGIANLDDASVPPALSASALAVLGLQTIDHVQPLARKAPGVHRLAGFGVQGIDPLLFQVAYDASPLITAANATAAIIAEGDLTQTLADLRQFETQHSLNPITTTVVNTGTAGADTSATNEWDIDSQDVLGMAGGQLANMIFYAATTLSDADLTTAYDAVVSADVAPVINVSLGECEFNAFVDGAMSADDQAFQTAVAQGQTFAVATGDIGSKECGNPAGSAAGASYPASSPYVVAVGGTTLTSDSAGHYGGETTWSLTGGSPSKLESQPSWQSGTVSGNKRGLPDIAFDADPNSGTIVVVNGQLQQWGGTSLAAPLFVGAWTRIQAANHARLGYPTTWIYTHGRQGTVAYHDIVSGSNGDYQAGPGWDYTTGFGSFDIASTALLTQSQVIVTTSPGTVQPGQPVTLTATVSGNAPTGKVQFYANGQPIGGQVPLSNGVATLTTTLNYYGASVSITAAYLGDLNDAPSTAAAVNEAVQVDVPALPPWATLLAAAGLLALVGRHRRRVNGA